MQAVHSAAASVLAFASCLCAQAAHPLTVPELFTGTYASGGNLLPFARTKGFIQTWYDGSNLPIPTVVTALGWRTDTTASSAPLVHTLEIVLDNTPKDFFSLDKTFANNLSAAPTKFYALKTLNLPATSAVDPDQPSTWIPGDTPFVYLGPHFLVQVDVQTSASPGSNTYYADAYSMGSLTTTLHNQTETSCASSSLLSSDTGSSFMLQFSGAVPSTPVTFLLGTDRQRLGGVPLPLDLTPFGLTGCVLAVAPQATVTVTADTIGSASLTVPWIAGPPALQLFAQAVHFTSRTTVGLGTTNLTGSLLGGAGTTNYLYNWTTFTPTSQYGPYPTNRGAVILLR